MTSLNPIIRSRAPLRVGLAGGGTDVSPFCDQYGGAVLNATISRYAYVTMSHPSSEHIMFRETDQVKEACYLTQPRLELDGENRLHKATYNYAVRHFNDGHAVPVDVSSHVEAPLGSGLGSSSTLVVALLKAYALFFGRPLDERALAQAAFEVERVEAGLAGGRQDQYAASFGGCNFMEFGCSDDVRVTRLSVDSWILAELEASLILVHTGQSRDSSSIIAEQSDNVHRGDQTALDATLRLKEDAYVMRDLLLRGDLKHLFQRMLASWDAKKALASNVCTPAIDAIYRCAISAGAICGKISGAGGGGIILFMVDPSLQQTVRTAVTRANPQTTILDCRFTACGSQAWRLTGD